MADFPTYSTPLMALVALLVVRLIGGRNPSTAGAGGATAKRRRDILARRADEAGGVPCAVMDWRSEERTATLVVSPGGAARLMFLEQGRTLVDGDGFAMGPARRFLEATERNQGEMHVTKDFREPPAGYACFWIVRDDMTLTSGDISLEDIRFRMTSWVGAWGSAAATVNELLEGYRMMRRSAGTPNQGTDVAAGPRSV